MQRRPWSEQGSKYGDRKSFAINLGHTYSPVIIWYKRVVAHADLTGEAPRHVTTGRMKPTLPERITTLITFSAVVT